MYIFIKLFIGFCTEVCLKLRKILHSSGFNRITSLYKHEYSFLTYQKYTESGYLQFPEIEQVKQNSKNQKLFGICFSGGGARSSSLTTGYLRGLKQTGLLSKVDYISCVSGGSWASSIYTFSNGDDDSILGRHVNPSELTEEYLEKKSAGLIADLVTTNNFVGFVDFFIGVLCDARRKVWSDLIAENFLSPFRLNNGLIFESYDHVKSFLERNPFVKEKFIVPKSSKPFLIINSTVFSSSECKPNQGLNLQITPLYSGVTTTRQNSGSHFIETCGLYSKTKTVSTKRRKRSWEPKPAINERVASELFTLEDAIGASSCAYVTEGSGFSWFVPSLEKPSSKKVEQLGDGGIIDNIGLLPLLQRKISSISCFINTYIPLEKRKIRELAEDDDIEQSLLLNLAAPEFLSYFGVFENNEQQWFYKRNQVFETKELVHVLKLMLKNYARGKGAVAQVKLEVIENDFWNIRHGFSADVFFVYNERCLNFESELPHETYMKIAKKQTSSEFTSHPHYSTLFQNSEVFSLSKPQVQILSAQAEFLIQENCKEFKSLLSLEGEWEVLDDFCSTYR
eukprot:snap_masked-scaffold_7-processed-gene-19.51-mRNA-1 protein AED:1.00 eAED:1.00 QI:0/-1/0/0/-1/1/1/0/565